MPPSSSPTFTPHTPTSLVQLLVYKPCSLFLILITPSYFVQEKKKNLYCLTTHAPPPFCIASIPSAPNSPISANQSCSSDSSDSSGSSDSSDSPTRYNPSMPSWRSSVSLQIISTRHFNQRCCAINSSCFFAISFIIVSIRPSLSDTSSSSSASSDSTSVSLAFPFPFASTSVFFLPLPRSDPCSAAPHPFFIAMHLWHEVLLPSLLKSAVKSNEHWMIHLPLPNTLFTRLHTPPATILLYLFLWQTPLLQLRP